MSAVYWSGLLPPEGAFWGRDFSQKRKTDIWKPFPIYTCSQPKLLTGKRTPLPEVISRDDLPDWEGWKERVDAFLKSGLKKVVLARQTTFTFTSPPSVAELLANLPNLGVKFAIESGGSYFFGSTPEHLFTRRGREIETEALAGTSTDPKELFASEKDQREFFFVCKFIQEALWELCEEYTESKLRVKKAGIVYHLHRKFVGTLKRGVDDAQIIERLHPTPAMGGVPRQAALQWIAAHEPLDRGWYSAPIGWSSCEHAEFAIAIRSGLLTGAKLHLFAGVGLVQGSDPQKEWEELECKIAAWTTQLGLEASLTN